MRQVFRVTGQLRPVHDPLRETAYPPNPEERDGELHHLKSRAFYSLPYRSAEVDVMRHEDRIKQEAPGSEASSGKARLHEGIAVKERQVGGIAVAHDITAVLDSSQDDDHDKFHQRETGLVPSHSFQVQHSCSSI